jgi:hypothetical protein
LEAIESFSFHRRLSSLTIIQFINPFSLPFPSCATKVQPKMNNLDGYDKLEYQKAGDIRPLKLVALFKIIYETISIIAWRLPIGFSNLVKRFLFAKAENLSGQLCLVTGGANGIGRCLAMSFAKEGCNIAIVDLLDPSSTVKEISETFNVKCCGFKCDVADTLSLENMKKQVEKVMGPVDILVNNAGVVLSGSLVSNSFETIEKCVAVNLTAHLKVEK